MLAEFIWIGNTECIKGLESGNQCPQGGVISLSDDVIRNSVTSSMPSSPNLASDGATELEGFGNEDTGTLLELGKPLPTLTGPHLLPCWSLNFCASQLDTSMGLRLWMSSTSCLKTLLGHNCGITQALYNHVSLIYI